MPPNDTLKAWLKRNDVSAAELARRCGDYDRSNFHRILNGGLWPSLELAHLIERETDGEIPMSAWAEAKAQDRAA